jgi:hypothetical protein
MFIGLPSYFSAFQESIEFDPIISIHVMSRSVRARMGMIKAE